MKPVEMQHPSLFTLMGRLKILPCVLIPVIPHYLECQQEIKYDPLRSVSNGSCQKYQGVPSVCILQYANQQGFLTVVTHSSQCRGSYITATQLLRKHKTDDELSWDNR